MARNLLALVLALGIVAAGAASARNSDPGQPTTRRMDAQAAPVSAGAQAEMIPVPGGAYTIGHADARPAARPVHEVTLPPFAIDRTEVTNAAYAEFLNALDLTVRRAFRYTRAERADFGPETWPELLEEGRNAELYPLIGLDDPEVRIEYRDGRFAPAQGYGEHPAAEVTWRGARDYCRWRGARLPTEVEWEAAARGKAGRPYPWGEAPPDDTRVYAGHPSGKTAPVGSRPAGATPSEMDVSSQSNSSATAWRPWSGAHDQPRSPTSETYTQAAVTSASLELTLSLHPATASAVPAPIPLSTSRREL
jgi:iron(II)-dependent oxidoreductase